MGKIVLIGLIVVIIILSVIVVNVEKETAKVPEIISQDMAEINAKTIANYALNYGIDKLSRDQISFAGNTTQHTFSDFNAFEGAIDSIRISCNVSKDTFYVNSFVNSSIVSEDVKNVSESIICKKEKLLKAAIIAAGEVVIKGNATIEGDVIEYATVDFEEIFGCTKEEMRANATRIYLDPPNNVEPVDDTTWVDLSGGNSLKVTNEHWHGTGILIVNGDCDITGGCFDGVLYVIGSLFVRGNDYALGIVFVECDADIETEIAGTSYIAYDEMIVTQYLPNPPMENVYKIIYWDE